MKLGVAGALTRSFIASPLTPLILLASLIVGMVALYTLPREEEPQISVPMVDIHVRADGLKEVRRCREAGDGAAETIVKAASSACLLADRRRPRHGYGALSGRHQL